MQLEADDIGDKHDQRLTEHRCLRLDTPHAPTDDTEPVDHCRVGVHSRHRVRTSHWCPVFLRAEYYLAQVFQIHLMADACVRRDDSKIAEGLLPPAQKCVALDITLVFYLGIETKGVRRAKVIYLNRVVDNEIAWRGGVDLF